MMFQPLMESIHQEQEKLLYESLRRGIFEFNSKERTNSPEIVHSTDKIVEEPEVSEALCDTVSQEVIPSIDNDVMGDEMDGGEGGEVDEVLRTSVAESSNKKGGKELNTMTQWINSSRKNFKLRSTYNLPKGSYNTSITQSIITSIDNKDTVQATMNFLRKIYDRNRVGTDSPICPIKNPGMQCYAISVHQLLSICLSLHKLQEAGLRYSDQVLAVMNKKPITFADIYLRSLQLHGKMNKKFQYVEYTEYKRMRNLVLEDYNNNRQMDSSEYLLRYLQQLFSEIPSSTNYFSINMTAEYKCIQCKSVTPESTPWNLWWLQFVDKKKNYSMQELVDNFLKGSCSDDEPRCETCNKNVKKTFEYSVDSLPDFVMFGLQRYYFSGGDTYKIQDFVESSPILRVPVADQSTKLYLHGVICHIGPKANVGHNNCFLIEGCNVKDVWKYHVLDDGFHLEIGKLEFDFFCGNHGYLFMYGKDPPSNFTNMYKSSFSTMGKHVETMKLALRRKSYRNKKTRSKRDSLCNIHEEEMEIGDLTLGHLSGGIPAASEESIEDKEDNNIDPLGSKEDTEVNLPTEDEVLTEDKENNQPEKSASKESTEDQGEKAHNKSDSKEGTGNNGEKEVHSSDFNDSQENSENVPPKVAKSRETELKLLKKRISDAGGFCLSCNVAVQGNRNIVRFQNQNKCIEICKKCVRHINDEQSFKDLVAKFSDNNCLICAKEVKGPYHSLSFLNICRECVWDQKCLCAGCFFPRKDINIPILYLWQKYISVPRGSPSLTALFMRYEHHQTESDWIKNLETICTDDVEAKKVAVCLDRYKVNFADLYEFINPVSTRTYVTIPVVNAAIFLLRSSLVEYPFSDSTYIFPPIYNKSNLKNVLLNSKEYKDYERLFFIGYNNEETCWAALLVVRAKEATHFFSFDTLPSMKKSQDIFLTDVMEMIASVENKNEGCLFKLPWKDESTVTGPFPKTEYGKYARMTIFDSGPICLFFAWEVLRSVSFTNSYFSPNRITRMVMFCLLSMDERYGQYEDFKAVSEEIYKSDFEKPEDGNI